MKRILFFLLFVVIISACNRSRYNDPANEKNIGMTTFSVVAYGNGVYFFPAEGAKFGNALSDFIGKNKSLELVSMASSERHPKTEGYFVVFKEKK